jgi:hypothetical protein
VRSSSLSLSLAFVDPCGFGGDPGKYMLTHTYRSLIVYFAFVCPLTPYLDPLLWFKDREELSRSVKEWNRQA